MIPNVVGQTTTGSVALPEMAVLEVMVPEVALGVTDAAGLEVVFPRGDLPAVVEVRLGVGVTREVAVAEVPVCPWKKKTRPTMANPRNATTAPADLGCPRSEGVEGCFGDTGIKSSWREVGKTSPGRSTSNARHGRSLRPFTWEAAVSMHERVQRSEAFCADSGNGRDTAMHRLSAALAPRRGMCAIVFVLKR